MATYIVGQTLVFGFKTNSTGALVDVGTGPTCTVTKPDGTTTSGSVTKVSTGTYTATALATALSSEPARNARAFSVELAASGNGHVY